MLYIMALVVVAMAVCFLLSAEKYTAAAIATGAAGVVALVGLIRRNGGPPGPSDCD